MTPSWQPDADLALLQQRARMLKNIRAFFDERNVLEVETPLLSRYGVTDPHLDSLQLTLAVSLCTLIPRRNIA